MLPDDLAAQEPAVLAAYAGGAPVVEKRQGGIAAPLHDGHRLVQQRTGEDHGTARRRLVDTRSEFREAQPAPGVLSRVEVDGNGEAPVRRAQRRVVAVR